MTTKRYAISRISTGEALGYAFNRSATAAIEAYVEQARPEDAVDASDLRAINAGSLRDITSKHGAGLIKAVINATIVAGATPASAFAAGCFAAEITDHRVNRGCAAIRERMRETPDSGLSFALALLKTTVNDGAYRRTRPWANRAGKDQDFISSRVRRAERTATEAFCRVARQIEKDTGGRK